MFFFVRLTVVMSSLPSNRNPNEDTYVTNIVKGKEAHTEHEKGWKGLKEGYLEGVGGRKWGVDIILFQLKNRNKKQMFVHELL